MCPGRRAVDPEGTAIEQLDEKGTSLGGPWGDGAAADPAVTPVQEQIQQ